MTSTIFISCRTVGDVSAPEPFDMHGTVSGALRYLAALRDASDPKGRAAFTATEKDLDSGKPAMTIIDGGEALEFFLTTVRAA